MNDPTQYPSPDRYHGSYHWAFERLISVSLVPLCAVAAVRHGMSGAVDGALSVALLLHSHMGFENVLTDYVEKRKYPVAAPITVWFVRALTVATGIGLYGTYQLADLAEFNTSAYSYGPWARRCGALRHEIAWQHACSCRLCARNDFPGQMLRINTDTSVSCYPIQTTLVRGTHCEHRTNTQASRSLLLSCGLRKAQAMFVVLNWMTTYDSWAGFNRWDLHN